MVSLDFIHRQNLKYMFDFVLCIMDESNSIKRKIREFSSKGKFIRSNSVSDSTNAWTFHSRILQFNISNT